MSLLSTDSYAAPSVAKVTGVELMGFVEYPDKGVTRKQAVAIAFDTLKRYRYTLTPEQLHSVADALTLYLREQGFQFSYAFLPQQNLSFGVLRIQFVEGVLSDVQVLNSNRTAVRATLIGAFDDLLNEPVYAPEIENRVKALKADQRIDVFAYYSRGNEPGEARLNIRVNRFDRWQTVIRADNYGSPSTGEHRLIAQTSLFSVASRQDTLTLGALVAQGEDVDEANTYGYLAYDSPLWSQNSRLNLTVGNNQFQVGGDFSALDLEGDATIARMGVSQAFFKTHESSHTLSIAAVRKTTDFTSALRDPLLEQDEEISAFEIGWKYQNRFNQGLSSLMLDFKGVSGEYEIESSETIEDDFSKLDAYISITTLLGVKHRAASDLRLYLRGQYSEEALPNGEQASFSGAYGVRALEAGYFAADRLGLVSFEWRLPRLFNRKGAERCCFLAPLVVIDGGYGEKLLDQTVSDRVTAWGAGVGVEFVGWQALSLRLLALDDLELESKNEVTATSMDFLAEVAVSF
ncbi:MAG: hypothetical protein MI867_26520 [Pseudomonadales bacterium]|nr:hypothetical protein [Pseudomonadales bacterium]